MCEIAVHTSPSPGACVFIDHEGLNERKTTTDGTVRRWNLRQDVIRRDGACVVTGTEASSCDAAHLIPHSKGDGVRIVLNSYYHLIMLFSSTLKK